MKEPAINAVGISGKADCLQEWQIATLLAADN